MYRLSAIERFKITHVYPEYTYSHTLAGLERAFMPDGRRVSGTFNPHGNHSRCSPCFTKDFRYVCAPAANRNAATERLARSSFPRLSSATFVAKVSVHIPPTSSSRASANDSSCFQVYPKLWNVFGLLIRPSTGGGRRRHT